MQAAAVLWSVGAKDVGPEDFSLAPREEKENSIDDFAAHLKRSLGAVEVPAEGE